MIKFAYDFRGKVSQVFLEQGDYTFLPETPSVEHDVFTLQFGIELPFDVVSKTIDFNSIEYIPTKVILEKVCTQSEELKNFDWITAFQDKPELATALPLSSTNWQELQDRGLSGNLNPMFQRLTLVGFNSSSPALIGAKSDLIASIINIRTEGSLISSLYLVTDVASYEFTNEEKALWNSTMSELGFSPACFIG